MIQGENVFINGDGATSRYFCYIDNTVQANLLSATTSGHHPNLHSYPTRRSSDLFVAWLSTVAPDYRVLRQPLDASRSEEHTSELQSRRELVCRLLFEKKNSTSSANAKIQTARTLQ